MSSKLYSNIQTPVVTVVIGDSKTLLSLWCLQCTSLSAPYMSYHEEISGPQCEKIVIGIQQYKSTASHSASGEFFHSLRATWWPFINLVSNNLSQNKKTEQGIFNVQLDAGIALMIWLLVDGPKCYNYRQQAGATFMKNLKLDLTMCSILCTTGFLCALHKKICIGTVTGDLKSK